MEILGLWGLPIIGFSFLIIFMIMFFASRYKRCPSDKILVIYGKVGRGQSARCIHGGGALIWPLIQDYAYMDLTPMTISIPLQNALSLQNIRINVPSTFTVGVSVDPAIMNNAAERLLHLKSGDIEEMAKEIIFGQLRLTVASLTIEQINQDRESFLESIRRNVSPELNKIGLYLINVNITDITDESGYIVSIGKKAAAEAINQAKIDVADQEKHGSIGEAEANREKDVRVAENIAQAEKGKKKADSDRRIYVQKMEAEAVDGENTSKANIADYDARLAVKAADAHKRGEVAKRDAEVEIQKAQYKAEQQRLNAEEIVRQETDKRKIEIAAEAEAERIRREARGQADAILMKYEAEAEGIRKVLQGKADGYKELVSSSANDPKSAATLLVIEKLEEIVALQIEAVKNLKIDKVTVWDSGGGDGHGTSTSNFFSNLIKSLPPLHEVSKMAGLDLPDFLGQVKKEADEAMAKPSPKTSKKPTPKPKPATPPADESGSE